MNPLTIRKWHGYLGMFIAPSVLFFALTGAVQLFSLHEAHGGYHPPALLEKLGKLHKDQVCEKKPDDDDDHAEHAPAAISATSSGSASAGSADSAPKPDHDAATAEPGGGEHEHHHAQKAPRVTVYFLKWFCLFVALGLFISTAFGIWMGLQQPLRRRTHVILLMIGIFVPLILIVV